jgi:7-carboxy-7-deazaguanine synthase
VFGKNPVRKQDRGDGLELWVQSVFHTIQGEGPFAGTPAIFIRMAGCNLRCFWCDTDFESSEWHPTVEQLVDQVLTASLEVPGSRLIVITGGEPMRQNILPLIRRLLLYEFRVQIETAGTIWVDGLEDVMSFCPSRDDALTIVVSPKTGKVHPMVERHAIAWKYIIRNLEYSTVDGLPIFSTQVPGVSQPLARPPAGAMVFVQPCDEQKEVKFTKANTEACVRLAKKFGYKISLQQHKILGVE